MTILGEIIIGERTCKGQGRELYALTAGTGEKLQPAFRAATVADVAAACELAEAAFDTFRALPDERRAAFLDAIAENLIAWGDELIERAHQESGLPKARLEGERMRTVNQLRLFATVLRDGRWHGVAIDSARPAAASLPRPDLRLRRIGLGPVAVFGASNFPLAFSVAGGDTASALAAGCPVIVKSHPAHLGTSELAARAIRRAAIETKMPDGVFSLLIGDGNETGEQLVQHPAIRAVGFTGSRQGGLALLRIGQARPQPIPVYAEMSSVNPVFMLPAALATRGDKIAHGFVDSLVLGAGQFCTNPGLVIALEGAALDTFCALASEALSARPAAAMLTPDIHAAYCAGLQRFEKLGAVSRLGRGMAPVAPFDAQAALFRTTAREFLDEPSMAEENFGPSSLIIGCRNIEELRLLANRLSGQLTVTVHLDDADHDTARELLPILERKAGRILFNDFPTGVQVSYAMVHSGPFPATSDSRSTSVGAAAIERFLRPVCYQDVPDALLPDALKAANPLNIWRLVDGTLLKV